MRNHPIGKGLFLGDQKRVGLPPDDWSAQSECDRLVHFPKNKKVVYCSWSQRKVPVLGIVGHYYQH